MIVVVAGFGVLWGYFGPREPVRVTVADKWVERDRDTDSDGHTTTTVRYKVRATDGKVYDAGSGTFATLRMGRLYDCKLPKKALGMRIDSTLHDCTEAQATPIP